MKYSLPFLVLISFAYAAFAQKTLHRPFTLINTINYGNGNILVTGFDRDSICLETYTFYGDPLASIKFKSNQFLYSQPAFWHRNRFYYILAVDSVHYQLVVMDEQLTIVERNDLGTDFSLYLIYRASFTPFGERLYAITQGQSGGQYFLNEYDLKGRLLARKDIGIYHISTTWWSKLVPYEGNFLYNRYFDNDTLYTISMDGLKSKMALTTGRWENCFFLKDKMLYTAGNNFRRYIFFKYDLRGNILDSFSTPVPGNGYDNIGTSYMDNYFFPINDEVFCYINEYRINNASFESNQIAYFINFNKRSVEPFRHLVNQRTSNLIVKTHQGKLLYAYNKDMSIVDSNKIGQSRPDWHTILEFPSIPDRCTVRHSPNPAEASFTMSSPCFQNNSIVKVQLFDLTGKLCFESEVLANNQRIEINSALRSGLYVCAVFFNETRLSFKQMIL